MPPEAVPAGRAACRCEYRPRSARRMPSRAMSVHSRWRRPASVARARARPGSWTRTRPGHAPAGATHHRHRAACPALAVMRSPPNSASHDSTGGPAHGPPASRPPPAVRRRPGCVPRRRAGVHHRPSAPSARSRDLPQQRRERIAASARRIQIDYMQPFGTLCKYSAARPAAARPRNASRGRSRPVPAGLSRPSRTSMAGYTVKPVIAVRTDEALQQSRADGARAPWDGIAPLAMLPCCTTAAKRPVLAAAQAVVVDAAA